MNKTEKNLATIATWSSFISWLLAALYLAISITRVIDMAKTPLAFDYTLYANLTNLLYPLLSGAFYFLVLQAIAHGIEFLLDLRESIIEEEPEEENQSSEPEIERDAEA